MHKILVILEHLHQSSHVSISPNWSKILGEEQWHATCGYTLSSPKLKFCFKIVFLLQLSLSLSIFCPLPSSSSSLFSCPLSFSLLSHGSECISKKKKSHVLEHCIFASTLSSSSSSISLSLSLKPRIRADPSMVWTSEQGQRWWCVAVVVCPFSLTLLLIQRDRTAASSGQFRSILAAGWWRNVSLSFPLSRPNLGWWQKVGSHLNGITLDSN